MDSFLKNFLKFFKKIQIRPNFPAVPAAERFRLRLVHFCKRDCFFGKEYHILPHLYRKKAEPVWFPKPAPPQKALLQLLAAASQKAAISARAERRLPCIKLASRPPPRPCRASFMARPRGRTSPSAAARAY